MPCTDREVREKTLESPAVQSMQPPFTLSPSRYPVAVCRTVILHIHGSIQVGTHVKRGAISQDRYRQLSWTIGGLDRCLCEIMIGNMALEVVLQQGRSRFHGCDLDLVHNFGFDVA